eukprot:TRINITY_DN2398_c0_g2_i1.p1 TRINITY_DN2398_c0_g2~~TRINITY_DN2398_c0_g2_i1.p1  ORF type:complete len:284 (+),score=61.06 TRINITY_DN2398_c0_g2_i1:36-887(+)
MNDLMRRLQFIRQECGTGNDAEKGQAKKGDKVDEFTRLKRDIANHLREARTKIKMRDQSMSKDGSTQDSVVVNAKIRTLIRESKERSKELTTVHQQLSKKWKKSKDPQHQRMLETQKEHIAIVNDHIHEVEELQRKKFAVKSNRPQLSLAPVVVGTPQPDGVTTPSDDPEATELAPIPEEVMEGLAQLEATNMVIEQELDDVSVGVQRLKHLAVDMKQELDHQDNLIEDIEGGMEKTERELKNLNKRMKKTLNRVRKGDKFLMDLVMLCIILGIAAYIYRMMQ